jgi:hypothetical protein
MLQLAGCAGMATDSAAVIMALQVPKRLLMFSICLAKSKFSPSLDINRRVKLNKLMSTGFCSWLRN